MKIRLLKLTTQEAVMVSICREDDTHVFVDNPCLVFAEKKSDGDTKISYIPWVPFYDNNKGISVLKNSIITGMFEEVNKELAERYSKMINPNQIIMPNNGIIL